MSMSYVNLIVSELGLGLTETGCDPQENTDTDPTRQKKKPGSRSDLKDLQTNRNNFIILTF